MNRCLSLGSWLNVAFAPGLWRSRETAAPSDIPAPLAAPELQLAPPQPISMPPAALCGTVVRDGGRFALREANGSLYALDSTGRAWPYEGEEVRVTGHLDVNSRLLHISTIQEIEDLRAEAV